MKERKIALWICVVSVLVAILGIFVGCSLYFSPSTFIPQVDFSVAGNRYIAEMWAARQIAMALVMLFCVFKQYAQGLAIILSAYCIMNIQDAVIGYIHNDMSLVFGASVFTLLTGFMARKLL